MATRGGRRARDTVRALPWIGPALILIGAIVVFPVYYLIRTSTRQLSEYGVDQGAAGLDNYRQIFDNPAINRVFVNTAVWVFVVVAITLLLSMGLAQFLNKNFPGRKAIRLAILVPWAASVVMTSTVFFYMLDPNVGVFNQFLVDVGILDNPYGFTKQPLRAFIVAIVVAVFVSIPFTTYVLLAGLQTIPDEQLEAAEVDGASRWQRYRSIVLPQLRQAFAVAVIINMINVFNSLPILRIITGPISGYEADTTTSLTFKLISPLQQVDTAAALSVLNFGLVLAIVAGYLAITRPMREN